MVSRIGKLFAALFWLLSRNHVTIFGSLLTTFSAATIFLLLSLEVFGILTSPYLGIVAFLIMPGLFVTGLVLIPIGAIAQTRRDRKHGVERQPHVDLPTIDFNAPRTRRVAAMVAFLTLVNLAILGATSYSSVVYMDSVEFCGKVCHEVMEPEFTAYEHSPHSRVECVECHIGPGAPWFVKAKLSGVHQVFAVTFNTHARPIPAPVENLRPSRDTCEQCHQPNKFTGDRVRVITHYAEDETNTPMYTVLLMHIGGGTSSHGIHSWHIDPARETTYVALDPQRQEIAKVSVKEPDGSITEFFMNGEEPSAEAMANAEVRTMDCIDCHNRPTHIFELPKDAVDKAIHQGLIDRSLPYIRKVAVETLTEAKGQEGDLDRIARRLETYYKENHPQVVETQGDILGQTIKQVQAIYSRNVFPNMNVTWGTYTNNLSHIDTPGCFRCHDGSHTTKDGAKTIGQDCSLCHGVLAMDEPNPQVLMDLGILDPTAP